MVPPVTDPALPAVEVLLGPAAEAVLTAALATTGLTVERYRTVQVRYVPGRSITTQHLVTLAETPPRDVTVVAGSGLEVPEDVVTLDAAGARIAVWMFPHDPFLPGLASITNREQAGAVLARLGAAQADPRIRTRAYRPGRRAVVELTTADARIYAKVLRPSKVADLQAHHRRLATHLPVPHSLGWSQQLGIVALEAMPGATLRKAIERGDDLPAPADVVALLDRLPHDEERLTPTLGALRRAGSHARLLHAIVPEERERIDKIVSAFDATVDDEADVPVHGDFHASQLMVDGPQVVGLVDVDTAGIGKRSDDLANLVGHLVTVATFSKAGPQLVEYGVRLLRVFDQLAPPPLLRRKIAATIFGLASGPFRVQDLDWPDAVRRRLGLTEQWLESATRADP